MLNFLNWGKWAKQAGDFRVLMKNSNWKKKSLLIKDYFESVTNFPVAVLGRVMILIENILITVNLWSYLNLKKLKYLFALRFLWLLYAKWEVHPRICLSRKRYSDYGYEIFRFCINVGSSKSIRAWSN